LKGWGVSKEFLQEGKGSGKQNVCSGGATHPWEQKRNPELEVPVATKGRAVRAKGMANAGEKRE